MLLLTAAALASPLDDAAQTGRPVVVLVERKDSDHHAAVWLRHATGDARSRIDAVTLVLATPEELATWTGRAIDADSDLIRLDPVRHKQIAARRVALPEAEEGSNAAPLAQVTEKQMWSAVRETVSAWDDALRKLVPRDLQILPPFGGRPVVLGATWCHETGCGTVCEPDLPESSSSCGMGHVDLLSVDLLTRWDPP